MSQQIQNNPKWGEAGAFGYQLAMSMGDFLLAAGLTGGSSGAACAIMGTGAAAETVIDAKDRGLSDGQAFTLGTVAGLAETLTEKYSLETLLDADALADSVGKYVLKNMAAEGSEEAASGLINLMADIVVSKDKSQWMQAMQQYQDMGYSKAEAFGKALADQAAALGLDALGGAISGGILGSGNAIRSSVQSKNVGTVASAMGMNDAEVQRFVGAGLDADPNSTQYKVAKEMSQKLQQGKQLTAEDKGRLASANMTMTNEMVRKNAGSVSLATPQVNVGNDDIKWQQAQRLSLLTGRDIVFYNGSPNEEGYFQNGKIHINANVVKGETFAPVFAHELTHSAEMADVYEDLQRLAFQKLRNLGQDISQMRKDKMEQYEAEGHPLGSEKEVDQEIVARFVQDYLLTDELTIQEVVLDSPSLGRKILNWIDQLLAKMGNENAQERVFLNNARKIYSEALKQTRNNQRPAAQQAENTPVPESGTSQQTQSAEDSETVTALEEVRLAYERGEFDEATYNIIVDTMQQEAQRRKEESARKYSFAGEKARTANLETLRQAKDLESQNVANETIRQQTGWFKGADGKWRFEIDDSSMRYFRSGDARFAQMHEDYARHQELEHRFLTGDISQRELAELQELSKIWGRERSRLNQRVVSGGATLQNIIQHDALFEAYPELQGAKVRFEKLEAGHRGSYYPSNNLIILNSDLRNAPQSTLLHEVQHAIQNAEGFASGSNREYWDDRLTRGDTPRTIGLADAENRVNAFEQDPDNAEVMELLSAMQDAEISGDDIAYEALEQEIIERGLQAKAQEYDALMTAYYGQESRAFNMMPSELYQNTAGEIEARDTAERQNMTAEERKKSPPNLGDDRTVFADRHHGSDYIAQTVDGRSVAVVESDILQDIYDGVWTDTKMREARKAALSSLEKFRDGISVSGILHKVDRTTKREYTRSNDTRRQYVNAPDIFADKMRAADIADDVVTAVPNWTNDGKLKHPRTDFVDFRKGTTLIKSGPAMYEGTVVVGITPSGEYVLYDVVGMTPTIFQIKNPGSSSTVTTQIAPDDIYENPVGNRVAQNEAGVKQYSLNGEETFSSLRDNLNRKATEYLARVESRFVRQLGNQLGIPRYAQWDIVRPVIDSMVDEFLQTGKISDETLANAFNTAYDQGKVSDREFYDQYKDVKDHLRTTPVTLSQRDQADIPDFNLWRKSMFGSLRIVNEGGLPVDTAYQELHSMAPELFPERIAHPADQLQRMGEVAQQIRKVEKSLDEYYGPEAGEFRRWAQHDFGTAIGDMMPELRTVKRYAEQEQKEAAAHPKLKTTKDAQEAFRKRKQAQKDKDAARARNLLSEQDNRIVKQLLDGIVTLEELEGKDLNLKGIREVYEAVREYEMIDRQIRQYQADLRAKRQDDADSHLSSSLYWRDKKSGFALSRETMRRNILDIVTNRSEAISLLKDYFEPVQIAEAERQRFLNKYRNKIRELNLSTTPAKGDEVSEAYAVQLYGEAITSIEMIQQSKGRLKERDGRDIDDWQGLICDMFQHSPSLDQAKIENAVKAFRQIYDEFFQKMNEVLVRNGYPPVEYRKGYFPHFQGQDDGMAAHFGKLLGTNFMDDVLPTTLNGLTHTFKPGKQWFANAQERTGFKTKYDAVEGFDKYIEGVSNVIFHTDNIQKLRALSRQIRYRSSDEGIKEEARRIQEDDRLTEAEKEEKLDKLYADGKFALSNFVTELDEYTNLLAGKKSMSDRGMERMLGRKYYTWMKHLESQVGANMVGGNIGSALTNFIPLTQAWGQLDTPNLLAGMIDTLKGMNKSDGFVGRSDFLTSRQGSDKLVQTWIQKASAKAGILMEVVDGFTSEAITRGAYYQNLQRGMSEAEALHQADIFAAGVIADRSKGSMPTVFEMKNPIAKIFTQFQLEVNNQMSEIFKDLPRAARERNGRQIAAMVFKYFIGAWLYNQIYEWLFGRRSALDPVDMLLDFGSDWMDGGLAAAGRNLAAGVVENIPFVGGLMGGGRVPISSAIPDVGAVWDALTEEAYQKDEVTGEETGIALNKRLSTLGTELAKPAMLLAFPFGGNQIMKAWKGIKTVLEGGSFVLNNAGERQLQYAVDTSDPWQLLGKALMASVMGKSALPEARAWTEGGFGSLSVKQTAVYDDLIEADVDAKEAYNIIDAIRKAAKTEDLTKAQVQRDLLEESGISDLGKAIVYYGLLASDSEREFMDSLTDIGATADAAGSIAMELYRIRQLPAEDRKSAQAEALKNAALTEEEKRTVIASLMDSTELLTDNGNPTEYAKFLAATEGGLSSDDYMGMRSMGVDTDDYLKFADTGISADAAIQIVKELKTLKTSAGAKEVSWLQKCQVVLDADLTEAQKLEALGAVGDLNDSTYEKVQLGYNMGMDLQSFFDLKTALPRYDANGNGSYTSKETKEAIDATFPQLSAKEKAVLWQLQNKSWKPKNNPYDKQVGQLVYDAMSSDAEQEQAVADDDPYALMRALSMIP